jgi:hypothetical protein
VGDNADVPLVIGTLSGAGRRRSRNQYGATVSPSVRHRVHPGLKSGQEAGPPIGR